MHIFTGYFFRSLSAITLPLSLLFRTSNLQQICYDIIFASPLSLKDGEIACKVSGPEVCASLDEGFGCFQMTVEGRPVKGGITSFVALIDVVGVGVEVQDLEDVGEQSYSK